MTRNEKGQSTIEFIFCFIFAVSLILLVFNTSLNYASGYVAHYATYMASRVFFTYDTNETSWGAPQGSGAVNAANDTFAKYKLDVFGIQNGSFQIRRGEANVSAGEYLMIGGVTYFKRKIDLVGKITGQTELDLYSEAYLGREFTRGVCASRTCYAITGSNQCRDNVMDITLFDNGC